MAGLILGCYGFQRSGKTFIAALISEMLRSKYDIPVFTNMNSKHFIHIKSLNEIPLDKKPKVLLIDEAYMSLDSRDWQKNAGITKFFNTIGKQNILLILTAPFPDMIEMRIRRQHNYVIFAKGSANLMTYKLVDMQRQKERMFIIPKTKEMFNMVEYDTLDFPDSVEMKFNKIGG